MLRGHPEHDRRKAQGHADEQRAAEGAFHIALQHRAQHQREGGDQDQYHQPAGGPVPEAEAVEDPAEPLHHQRLDILPEGRHHGHQRPQMEHQVKRHGVYIVLVKIQQRLHQRQMTGGGDGQEFRKALHRAQ